MAVVATYYSSNPLDPPVYHDHDDCPAANEIPDCCRREGTGGYRRCQHCETFRCLSDGVFASADRCTS